MSQDHVFKGFTADALGSAAREHFSLNAGNGTQLIVVRGVTFDFSSGFGAPKARYSKHYHIDLEELNWLAERVEALGRATHTICTAHIAKLAEKARH